VAFKGALLTYEFTRNFFFGVTLMHSLQNRILI